MLILQRKVGESILIGEDIEIIVSDISNNRVKIAIKAPKEYSILRSELLEAINENKEAKDSKKSDILNFRKILENK